MIISYTLIECYFIFDYYIMGNNIYTFSNKQKNVKIDIDLQITRKCQNCCKILYNSNEDFCDNCYTFSDIDDDIASEIQ